MRNIKKGGGLLCKRKFIRFKFIKEQKKAYPITILCSTMNISRGSYYAWLKRGESKTDQENRVMAQIVRKTHKIAKRAYGQRRHALELTAQGFKFARQRCKTIMSIANVEAKQKKKYKATTDSNHKMKVFPNLLERNFIVKKQNQAWVSDITYIRTNVGWLYLAVVIDLFNREVVGWSMSKKIDRHLVLDATRMAIWKQKPKVGLIFHSDRGRQYCSDDFKKYIAGYGILGSMSRKGNCWDNAVAESFFSSLKKERVFSNTYKNRQEAKEDILDYIEMFYNNFRRHSFLGYKSPREFLKIMENKIEVA